MEKEIRLELTITSQFWLDWLNNQGDLTFRRKGTTNQYLLSCPVHSVINLWKKWKFSNIPFLVMSRVLWAAQQVGVIPFDLPEQVPDYIKRDFKLDTSIIGAADVKRSHRIR